MSVQVKRALNALVRVAYLDSRVRFVRKCGCRSKSFLRPMKLHAVYRCLRCTGKVTQEELALWKIN